VASLSPDQISVVFVAAGREQRLTLNNASVFRASSQAASAPDQDE
jgi:hypothetical protein